MHDRIEVRGLRVLGHHGDAGGEQDRPQPFEVDLDVVADLAPAGRSDHLADTLDYAAMVDLASAVVRDERHRLLERLATRIAEEVGAHPLARSVTVTVRKLRPPLAADLATVAVRITRP